MNLVMEIYSDAAGEGGASCYYHGRFTPFSHVQMCTSADSLQGHLSVQIDRGRIHASAPSARFHDGAAEPWAVTALAIQTCVPTCGQKRHVSVPVFVSCSLEQSTTHLHLTRTNLQIFIFFYHCYRSGAQQGAAAINKNASKLNCLIWAKCFGYLKKKKYCLFCKQN